VPVDHTKLRDRIKELTSIAAPSGNEDRLVAHVVELLRGGGHEPIVDRIGNVRVGLGPQPAVDGGLLIFAHLDELGLVVRNVTPDGFLRVHRLGGVPERVLPGTRLIVHAQHGDHQAVVGLKAHHLTPPEEKYVARPASDLYLDIGLTSATAVVDAGIRVGDPITYAPLWTDLANGRFAAKALDNRLGVAVLLALIDRWTTAAPSIPVTVAFSVQEEFNVRGALSIARAVRPTLALCLDITPATDPPDLVAESPVRLGDGPVLSRMSFHGRGTLGGLVPHPALVRGLEAAARDAGMPVQYEAIIGVITDAAFLPMATPEAIATAGIGIPVRYTHSPVETGSVDDVAATIHLIEAFARLVPDLDLERGEPQLGLGGMA